MKKIIIILMGISMLLTSCSSPSNYTDYDEKNSTSTEETQEIDSEIEDNEDETEEDNEDETSTETMDDDTKNETSTEEENNDDETSTETTNDDTDTKDETSAEEENSNNENEENDDIDETSIDEENDETKESSITILSNQTLNTFNYYITSGISKEKLNLITSDSLNGILNGVYNSHNIKLSIRKNSNKLIISKFNNQSAFQIIEIKKDITNNKNIIIKIQFND